MALSKQFLVNGEKLLTHKNYVPSGPGNFVQNLLVQSKKLSQIIAYIWLNKTHAKILDDYFKETGDKKLVTLLTAHNKSAPPELLEALKDVFHDQPSNALPIFSEEEAQHYSFRVDVNKFQGAITDPYPGDDGILTLWIPYPPLPKISEKANAPINPNELEGWLSQPSNQPPYIYVDNPYIPTTSS
ncbi:hypothetical protein [Phormidium nigroviride]